MCISKILTLTNVISKTPERMVFCTSNKNVLKYAFRLDSITNK